MGLIVTSFEAGVLSLRLNRPEVLNSFNHEMASELQAALREGGKDEAVRVVLITGEGRAFCAGQDLSEVAPAPGGSLPNLGEVVRVNYNPIISLIRHLEKPVVAAVNGIAAGAGANLAFACDLVTAAREANFVQSFSKVGLIPDSGGTFMLPRLVGLQRATALCFLGEKLSAEEAQKIGLVYKICEKDVLGAEAFSLASNLATQPTRGFALTKKAFNQSFGNTLEQQLTLEGDYQALCGKTADYREGVTAFLQKRTPNFIGK